jgi:hypothetical protein
MTIRALRHITSHHTTSHRIRVLCYLEYLCRHTTSHISYHIISYHIISYHIISYHIISYHIISYHIISYHITRTSVPSFCSLVRVGIEVKVESQNFIINIHSVFVQNSTPYHSLLLLSFPFFFSLSMFIYPLSFHSFMFIVIFSTRSCVSIFFLVFRIAE